MPATWPRSHARRNWGDADARLKAARHGLLDEMGDDAPQWYGDIRRAVLAGDPSLPGRADAARRLSVMYDAAVEAGDTEGAACFARHLAEVGRPVKSP